MREDRRQPMILCSSGAFFHRREDGRFYVPGDSEVEAILAFGPKVPAEGVELLITRRMIGTLDRAAERIEDASIQVPVVHGPKRVGAALPGDEAVSILSESAEFAARIGAHSMVLHLWDLPESDADMPGRLEAVTVAADVAASHGIRLLIETVPCTHNTPLQNLARVVEHEPRVGIALDTEFIAMHDELEEALAADWLWDHGRVGHVHVKDYDGSAVGGDGRRRYLMPGEGDIDLPGFFRGLERRGFAGTVSLEAITHLPDGRPDLDGARRALHRMQHSPWRFA